MSLGCASGPPADPLPPVPGQRLLRETFPVSTPEFLWYSYSGRSPPPNPEDRIMKVTEEALKYLNLGIESEIAAYVFYRRAGKSIDDPSLRAVLDRLASDEKGHFLTLEDTFDRNVRSECWAPYKDILSKPGLPDIDEMVQETHKDLLARIRSLRTKREVLEMALALEKEAFDLFTNASSRAGDPEVQKVFDFLAAFEKGHVQTIEKELAALA
jgi:sulfur-carrier protein adenylyltransferase/sulfurtransferase